MTYYNILNIQTNLLCMTSKLNVTYNSSVKNIVKKIVI